MSSKQTKPGSDSGHAPQQVWFFLVEAMDDPTFKQGCGTLDELKKTRMTLQRCLELSGVSGKKASDFSFWIHSQSMKAAVQMLTDESIIGTWNLYCQKDPIVLVIIRKATDPSPNTSRTPSHANSLSARQQHSAKRGLLVPELFIQPKVRHASGYSDMETFEEITDESTMVSIVQNGKTYTFTRDYLQGMIVPT